VFFFPLLSFHVVLSLSLSTQISISVPSQYKRDGRFELAFTALGRNFRLALEPYTEIFAPEVQFFIDDGSNQTTVFDFDTSIYYKGFVIGEPTNPHFAVPVALTIEPESDHRVTGYIHTANER
jgi:hypothetical protein